MPNDPVLTVLFCGSLAAAAAAFGALPFAFGRRPRQGWVGAAYSLASGFMLGAGYLLMSEGLEAETLFAVLGGGVGVAYTWWTQTYPGTHRLDTRPGHEVGLDSGYKAILQSTLHSASEGVAIGVAMSVELGLGVFMALALAVHNVGEGMALTNVLRQRGMSVWESAGLCVVTNVPQPLMAIVAVALSPAFGHFLPAALGFSAGSLVFLVLTELAPASYERADKTWVAMLMSIAAATVVLLEHLFVGGG
ncbi:MAG: ZIP family metal transporter [bacterium]|nr:ZIP family metal transporter [bacterium]